MSPGCLKGKSRKLKFNANNQFKILQLADLHYENDSEIIRNNQAITKKLLELESPEMVIFSGDQVSGWYSQVDGWYAEMFGHVVKELIDKSIPWASVLGNHDREADLTPQQITCLDSSYDLSFTGQGIVNPNNNLDYILPIYDYKNDLQINAYLIMMDSGRIDCEGDSTTNTGCITSSQTEWLQNTFTAGIYTNTNVLMFVHQPLIQHSTVYHKHQTFGHQYEISSCPEKETGIYKALFEMAVVHSVNVGHDHNNDFTGKIDGLAPALSYGRKTGFGSYGPDFGVSRGARVLQINSSGITGWIRTEGGVEFQPPHNPFPIYWDCKGKASPVLWMIEIILFLMIISIGSFLTWRLRIKRHYRELRSSDSDEL